MSLFDDMEVAFGEAVEHHPDLLRERWFSFARHPVVMRVVGDELAAVTFAPFAHLRRDGAPSGRDRELTVHLWDETATGVALPESVGGLEAHLTGIGALAHHDPIHPVAVWCTAPGEVMQLDRRRQLIVGWRADATDLLLFQRGKPLSLLLPVWYSDRSTHVIHAGLVGRGDRAVLVAGDPGAGKSTTSLACAADGFDFLADDHVVVDEAADGTFVGHSAYGTARIDPEQLARRPELAGGGEVEHDPSPDEKSLVFAVGSSISLATETTINAIVLPNVGGPPERDPSLRPASPRDALVALAPTSLFTIVADRTKLFERLGRMAERLPAYWLDIGDGTNGIADTVATILDRTG